MQRLRVPKLSSSQDAFRHTFHDPRPMRRLFFLSSFLPRSLSLLSLSVSFHPHFRNTTRRARRTVRDPCNNFAIIVIWSNNEDGRIFINIRTYSNDTPVKLKINDIVWIGKDTCFFQRFFSNSLRVRRKERGRGEKLVPKSRSFRGIFKSCASVEGIEEYLRRWYTVIREALIEAGILSGFQIFSV